MSGATRYQTSGTSALKPAYQTSTLTVYEGGARSVATEGAGARRPRSPQATGSRGSILATVGVILAIVATLWAASAAQGLSVRSLDATLDSAPRETIYVQPGDTLWSIASARAGGQASTEHVVSWIMQANGLSQAAISPGERLVVPVLAP